MEITAKALRSRVGEILACLDRGESVTITYRGKPRARLVGIESGSEDDTTRRQGISRLRHVEGP